MDNSFPLILFKMNSSKSLSALPAGTPHFEYLNLCVTYQYLVTPDDKLIDSLPVDEAFCASHSLSPDDLHALASQSLDSFFKPRLFHLSDYANELKGGSRVPNLYSIPLRLEPAIYMCTNQFKVYGAHFLYSKKVLKHLAQNLGESYYIIPSSINDFLLVPLSLSPSQDDLRELISESNADFLAPENQLSDDLYFYDADKDEISICRA